MLPVAFLTFQVLACLLEKGESNYQCAVREKPFEGKKCQELKACYNTSLSSVYISSFLIAWWMMKVVQASVRSKWRADLTVTIEKLAKMIVTKRQIIEMGLSQLIITGGMILFAAMGMRAGVDEKGVNIIGLLGGEQSPVYVSRSSDLRGIVHPYKEGSNESMESMITVLRSNKRRFIRHKNYL